MKTLTLKTAFFNEGQKPIYGDGVTFVEIEDELGGGFIVLSQIGASGHEEKIRFNGGELKLIAEVAEKMLADYDEVTA
jgi:hypothetical protein